MTAHSAVDALASGVPTDSRSTRLDRWVLGRIQHSVAPVPIAFALWDGFERRPSTPPLATISFRRRRVLYQWLWNPDLYFGESYMAGDVAIDGDLALLLEAVYRNVPVAQRHPRWRLPQFANSTRAARHNVHHHYDLGNDFYRLWLDPEMLYTCAFYPAPDATLEAAQIAKMDRVCRKLRLQRGERVIEAGCGWGSMALFMARHYGATVRAFNISSEQIAWARARARAEQLAGQVEFIEDDYRNVRGNCDVFVSLGMLEHVGARDYPTLGAVTRACVGA